MELDNGRFLTGKDKMTSHSGHWSLLTGSGRVRDLSDWSTQWSVGGGQQVESSRKLGVNN